MKLLLLFSILASNNSSPMIIGPTYLQYYLGEEVTSERILANFVIFDEDTPFEDLVITIDKSIDTKVLSKQEIVIEASDGINTSSYQVTIEIINPYRVIINGPTFIYTAPSNILNEEEILSHFTVFDNYLSKPKLQLNATQYYESPSDEGYYQCQVIYHDDYHSIAKPFIIQVIDNRREVPHLDDFTLTLAPSQLISPYELYNFLIQNNYLQALPYKSLTINSSFDNTKIGKYPMNIIFETLDYHYRPTEINFTLEITESKKEKCTLLDKIKEAIADFFKKLWKFICR